MPRLDFSAIELICKKAEPISQNINDAANVAVSAIEEVRAQHLKGKTETAAERRFRRWTLDAGSLAEKVFGSYCLLVYLQSEVSRLKNECEELNSCIGAEPILRSEWNESFFELTGDAINLPAKIETIQNGPLEGIKNKLVDLVSSLYRIPSSMALRERISDIYPHISAYDNALQNLSAGISGLCEHYAQFDQELSSGLNECWGDEGDPLVFVKQVIERVSNGTDAIGGVMAGASAMAVEKMVRVLPGVRVLEGISLVDEEAELAAKIGGAKAIGSVAPTFEIAGKTLGVVAVVLDAGQTAIMVYEDPEFEEKSILYKVASASVDAEIKIEIGVAAMAFGECVGTLVAGVTTIPSGGLGAILGTIAGALATAAFQYVGTAIYDLISTEDIYGNSLLKEIKDFKYGYLD